MSTGEVSAGGYSREQLRQSYADAWRKHLERAPLTPLEALIVDVLLLHPEYQRLVQDARATRDFEPAADEQENPFLHMGLHLAVREQSSIDRPPGIRALLAALMARCGDDHAAEHALMEALAEALWEGQRRGGAPDEGRYLELARRALSMPGRR